MTWILLATLALAAPDSGDTADSGHAPNECGTYGWTIDGTWTIGGCQSSPSPCGDDPCPTWDAVEEVLATYGTSHQPWTLDTCADGGHRASTCCVYEASRELHFAPSGELVASVYHCVGACAEGCCDGHSTTRVFSGSPRSCDVVETRIWPEPPEPGTPGDVTAPGTPIDTPVGEPTPTAPAPPRGCGCDHAPATPPWWLAALAVVARRRSRR